MTRLPEPSGSADELSAVLSLVHVILAVHRAVGERGGGLVPILAIGVALVVVPRIVACALSG